MDAGRIKLPSSLYGLVAFCFLGSCGTLVGNPEDHKGGDDKAPKVMPGGAVLEEQNPADSTGASGRVGLAIGAAGGAALALDGPPALKIGDDLVITYAKVSVAKIKIKAAKIPNEIEAELAKRENEAEKTAVQALDAVSGDAPAAALDLAGEAAKRADGAAHGGASPAATADGSGSKPGPGTPSEGAAAAGSGSSVRGGAAGSGSTVDAGSGGSGKVKKVAQSDRLAKIVAKKDELKKKDLAALDGEAKSDKATKFVGPFIYDAVAGKMEGEAPPVTAADGSYRRVEFQLRRAFSIAESEPLFGNVFAIQGTIVKDGVPVPFAIEWNVALNFRLAGDGAFPVAAGGENRLVIGLDVPRWFAGLDWSKAIIEADGTIYIDRLANRDLMNQLHTNMKAGTAFGLDKDGDGMVGSGETAGHGDATEDAVIP